MCYTVGSHAVASVPSASLGKLRWGRFEPKIGGGGRRSPASYDTLTTEYEYRMC